VVTLSVLGGRDRRPAVEPLVPAPPPSVSGVVPLPGAAGFPGGPSCAGEGEGEGRAAAGSEGVGAQVTLMGPGKSAGDGEADTGA